MEKKYLVLSGGSRIRLKRRMQLALLGLCSIGAAACGSIIQPSSDLASHSQNLAPSSTPGQTSRGIAASSEERSTIAPASSAGVAHNDRLAGPASGSVAGTPALAINSAVVTPAQPRGEYATENGANSLSADTCHGCVSVKVSPVNVSVAPGGTQQFAASVVNSANSGVTWSVSEGSITSTGMFTAPTKATGAITITATNVSHPAAHAIATVSLASDEPLKIENTNIPAASVSTPYDAQVNAAGGKPPYRWVVAEGSLPAGLHLASHSGAIQGTTGESGHFHLTLAVEDGEGHRAHRHFALHVSGPNDVCGPPAYHCSRSDLQVAQLQAAPRMGNLAGANSIATDPNFGNRIVRVTDSNTDPAAPEGSARSFVSSTSGSADENLWNLDSTLLLLQSNNGAAYPFSFDASTMKATRLYRSSFPATGGLKLTDSGTWSRSHPSTLYTSEGTTILKYDFSDRTNPPSPRTVFDFTEGQNCLPKGFSATWQTKGGVSAGDTTFGVALSNQGGQGTGVYAVVYRVGEGCALLDTRTGRVTGDWGTKGAINIPDRWTIHNVKLSKDGNWLVIAPQNCTSAKCSKGPYFWQIGTANVDSCGARGHCGGHWTEGYSHWVNNDNSPLGNQVIRSLSDSDGLPGDLMPRLPDGINGPFDQHQSWNNVDASDSVPFVASTWSSIEHFPAPWYNEIIGVATDGSGKVWRFAHSYITTKSQIFSAQYAIGSVSQDGRFFLFSSDWMGTLGSEFGSENCKIGKNCRADVFVVELN